MTAINQTANPPKVGDHVVKADGTTETITDQNKNDPLQAGDILFSPDTGSVVQIEDGGQEEVILDGGDINHKPLTTGIDDDVATEMASKSNYESFWTRLFGRGNSAQQDALKKAKEADDATIASDSKTNWDSKGSSGGTIASAKDAAKALAADEEFWKSPKQQFTKDELKAKLDDPNLDPTTRAAVEWLLDPANQSSFDAIETAVTGPGTKDGIISRNDLGQYSGIFDKNGRYTDSSVARYTGSTTTAPSPAPTTTAPSPAPTTTAPSPAPTTTAPSPAPTTTAPSPAPTTTAPSSAPTTTAPSPAPTTTAPNPAPTATAPTPTPTATAPSPAPTTTAPSPAPTTTAPSPAPTTTAPSPAPTTTAPSPAPTTTAPSPAPATSTITSPVQAYGELANCPALFMNGSGVANETELQLVANGDPSRGPVTDKQKAAAQYLLDHRDQLAPVEDGGHILQKSQMTVAVAANNKAEKSPVFTQDEINQINDPNQKDAFNAIPVNDAGFFNTDGSHTRRWWIAHEIAKNTPRQEELENALPPTSVAPRKYDSSGSKITNSRETMARLANDPDVWAHGQASLSKEDLIKIAESTSDVDSQPPGHYTKDTIAAARYVLDHPGMWEFLDGKDGKANNSVSQADLNDLDKAWSKGSDHYGHSSLYKDSSPTKDYRQAEAERLANAGYQASQWAGQTLPKIDSRQGAVDTLRNSKNQDIKDLIDGGKLDATMLQAIANSGPKSKYGDDVVAAAIYITQRPGMFDAINHCKGGQDDTVALTGVLSRKNLDGYHNSMTGSSLGMTTDQSVGDQLIFNK